MAENGDKFLSGLLIDILNINIDDDRAARLLWAMNEEGYEFDSGTIAIIFELLFKQQKEISDLREMIRMLNGTINSMH